MLELSTQDSTLVKQELTIQTRDQLQALLAKHVMLATTVQRGQPDNTTVHQVTSVTQVPETISTIHAPLELTILFREDRLEAVVPVLLATTVLSTPHCQFLVQREPIAMELLVNPH